MKYSALIFNKIDTNLFVEDMDCLQIVMCCDQEDILEFSMHPIPKTMVVKKSKALYIALLNGLKAISQENVFVINESVSKEEIETLKKELSAYPAIYLNENVQAFDTRLVMFCLQFAIESNLAIDSYAKAVELLADTPLKYL